MIFADFSIGYSPKMTGIPVLVGNFRDFSTNWYYNIGVKICVAMITNSIVPFISKLLQPVISSVKRYLDRCCKKHLRSISNLRAEKEKLQKKEDRYDYEKKVEESKRKE